MAKDWEELGREVDGRLLQSEPFAEPRFSSSFNSSGCLAARNIHLDKGEV